MISLNIHSFVKFFRFRLSFLTNKRQWAKGVICFGVVFGMLTWAKDHVGLLYSPTPSLPKNLFLHLKQLEPQKGNYTCVDSPWYGGMLIKEVAGTQGDVLSYDKAGNLWIGRHLKIGKPKKKAKDGRVLTPLKPGKIPKGKVFLASAHERSFDSRYEELGLVPQGQLQGRAVGLWPLANWSVRAEVLKG